MSQIHKEYDGSANNATPCYSNMNLYGSGGRYRRIIPPTPVTVQPWEFNLLRPHKMPNNNIKPIRKDHNCIPYRTLDEVHSMCSSKD